jgi:hypothetical protein
MYQVVLSMGMTFTKPQIGILTLTILYLLYFGQHYIRALDYEFIAYAVLIIGIMILMYGTLYITKLPLYIVAGISIWGLLHMMGGSIMTGDGVLYAWKIYPFFDGGGEFYILKFDQLVHAGLYAVVALIFLHFLREVYGIRQYQGLIGVIAVMAALGVSAINEIIEFAAVVLIPNTGVGGYHNTLLDIVFNLVGAIFAVALFYTLKKLKKGR